MCLTYSFCSILKFINWQSAAIKETNSGAMVTVSSWCEYTQTDSFTNTSICSTCVLSKNIIHLLLVMKSIGYYNHLIWIGNYYTDECLIAAGGKSRGTLDIYQMHTYANNGQWNENGPMKVSSEQDNQKWWWYYKWDFNIGFPPLGVCLCLRIE